MRTDVEGDEQGQQTAGRGSMSGPVKVGVFFASLAIVMSIVGLGRDNNLSLRNLALAVLLGGGSWGLVSWAIASAVAAVEEDLADRGTDDG
jgi:hypothetical protein